MLGKHSTIGSFADCDVRVGSCCETCLTGLTRGGMQVSKSPLKQYPPPSAGIRIRRLVITRVFDIMQSMAACKRLIIKRLVSQPFTVATRGKVYKWMDRYKRGEEGGSPRDIVVGRCWYRKQHQMHYNQLEWTNIFDVISRSSVRMGFGVGWFTLGVWLVVLVDVNKGHWSAYQFV